MGLCEKCRSKGLPIYPVRYAVSPNNIGTNLPTWAIKKELPELTENSKYVLRTSRQGYLYLFCQYEDSNMELDISVYKIDEKGGFWKQDISKELDLLRFNTYSVTDEEQLFIPSEEIETSCNNSAHESSNIAFITLSKPEKCDRAWLAFSEHKWSINTINQYLSSENKRNIRMQEINPKQWLSQQKSINGITTANKQAIGSTMEFEYCDAIQHNGKSIATHNYPINFPYLYSKPVTEAPISESAFSINDVFNYNKSLFERRTTLTPWFNAKLLSNESNLLQSYADFLFTKMMSSDRNSTSCPPMMVALIDSIGIVAELSNWLNSSISSIKKVMTERQWENTTCSGIQIFEEMIKKSNSNEEKNKYKAYLRRKNKYYLNSVYHMKNPALRLITVQVDLSCPDLNIPWPKEEVTKGERVLNIVNQAKSFNSYIVDGEYQSPYLTDIEKKVNLCKYYAKNLVLFIEENYYIEEVGDEPHATVFEEIIRLNKNSSEQRVDMLLSKINIMREEFKKKAEDDEKSWLKKNNTEQLNEKRWLKYKKNLLSDSNHIYHYEIYGEKYNQFLTESEKYTTRLIDDLIVWVDCRKQKERHPLTLAADDFAQDSDNYLAFANDVLMTLGSPIENNKITELFTQLVDDTALIGHNIFWSAVFAGRKLSKEQQNQLVNLFHSFNKTMPMDSTDYGELLNQFDSLLKFYEGDSEESKLLTQFSDFVNDYSSDILGNDDAYDSLEIVKEIASLFDSKRNFLLDGDADEEIITAAKLQPVKSTVSAVTIVIFSYLKKIGGVISSQFAEAIFVTLSPPRISKKALTKKMQAYNEWAKKVVNITTLHANSAATKLTSIYQNKIEKLNRIMSTQRAGATFIGFIGAYHLKTIYQIITDNSFKTDSEQKEQNYQLATATTAIISYSFQSVALYSNNLNLTEKTLKNVKFFGNFFGFISAVTQLCLSWNTDETDMSTESKQLYWVSFGASVIGTIDLFLQLRNSSLKLVMERSVQFLGTQLVSKLFLGRVAFGIVKSLISLTILALNPWFSLGIFLLQLILALSEKDDIEKWLERCRFGKLQSDFEKRFESYKTIEEEVKAMEAIFHKFNKEIAQSIEAQRLSEIRRHAITITSDDWSNLINFHF